MSGSDEAADDVDLDVVATEVWNAVDAVDAVDAWNAVDAAVATSFLWADGVVGELAAGNKSSPKSDAVPGTS